MQFGRNKLTNEDAENVYAETKVQNLNLALQRAEDQLRQLNQMTETHRSEASKNMSEIQRIAQTICDNEYAHEQLGGRNPILSMGAHQLANFIIDNWRKQRHEAIDLITDLQKALKRKDGELADLEAQLERVLQQQRDSARVNQVAPQPVPPQYVEHNGQTCDRETGEIIEKDLKSDQTPDILDVVRSAGTTTPQNPPQPPASSSDNGAFDDSFASPKTHLVLMEEIEQNLTDIQWQIITAIGADGLSESKEIEQRISDAGDVNRTQFGNAMNALKEKLIIAEDKVNTGWRWFFAYHLTDLGLQLFQKRHKKPAILCEKHVLRKENATWDHGYCIKDTATLLDMMGYQQITYGRQENTIPLTNGKTWIPDIIAYDTLARKKIYVEVELGHHTQQEFNEKMDKARQVTNELRFVTNDKQAMETVIAQFSRWKLEKVQSGAPVKNFMVYITTTKKLSEKDWFHEYPS